MRVGYNIGPISAIIIALVGTAFFLAVAMLAVIVFAGWMLICGIAWLLARLFGPDE